MNARLFLAGLTLALLLGAGGLWVQELSSRRERAAVTQANAEKIAAATRGRGLAEVQAAESGSRSAAEAAPGAARETVVLPLLELNAIADAGANESSADGFQHALDALLGPRYASLDRAQRERSLLAIREALATDERAARGKESQALSAASRRALQLEADWLKEHLDP